MIIWDTATWKPVATLNDSTTGVLAVSFSPDSSLLASGLYGKTAVIYKDFQPQCNGLPDPVVCQTTYKGKCNSPDLGELARKQCPAMCDGCTTSSSTTAAPAATTTNTSTPTTMLCNGKPDPASCAADDGKCTDASAGSVVRAQCPAMCDTCIPDQPSAGSSPTYIYSAVGGGAALLLLLFAIWRCDRKQKLDQPRLVYVNDTDDSWMGESTSSIL